MELYNQTRKVKFILYQDLNKTLILFIKKPELKAMYPNVLEWKKIDK